MKIPETPDEWVERYSILEDDNEKIFEYWMETMNTKLPEEFREGIGFLDYLIDYVNKMEQKKEMEKISQLIPRIYENNFEIVEENNFHYVERHLIDIKLFKNDIKYSDFEYFINNSIDCYDTFLRYLRKLIFYNHSQLVIDISKKIYPEIRDTEELIAGAEYDIARFIYFNKWQEVYNKLKQGLKVDRDGLIEFMRKYNFNIEDNYDQFITDLTSDLEFNQPEELFQKDKDRFYARFEFLFMRYLYENKNIDFVAGRELWVQIIETVLRNKQDEQDSVDSLDELFLLKRDVFRNNLSGYVQFMNNQYGLLFAVVWGSPYFYDFLYDYKLISEVIYKSALTVIENFKEEIMSSYSNELWKYNFVHEWEPPTGMEQSYYQLVKDLFAKTFVEVTDEISLKSDKMIASIENSPDKDFSNVGRNDPCPCGSGRKYKKCCLNRMEKQQRRKRMGRNDEFKRNLCWTVEEIEGMDTEEIMDYLFYFGIYFSREAFLNDLKELGSIDSVVESWYQKFNIDVNNYFHYDFIKIAPGVLAERFE